ncbi:MAG TPA: Ig-like domain-containing protein [Gemmatimonadaceae bacterium]
MTPRSRHTRSLLRHACLALAAAGLLACQDEDPTGPPSLSSAAESTALAAGSVVLVGAGNIARCGSSHDEATAQLLEKIPGTIFTTGDNVYSDGSYSEFRNCFGSSWGRFKDRIRPAVGDTEYDQQDASGYFAYFGSRAGKKGEGYYSYDAGEWHVVVLNSQIDMSANSRQVQWLRADLAASSKPCTIAIWHYPRFSSYSTHNRTSVKPLWDALYEHGAEIVVNGHYRFYERSAPQTPDGKADPAGIRQFIVGTGGTGTNPFDTAMPNSEVRKSGVYGVLKLTLGPGSYNWEFISAGGSSFTDTGSGLCNGGLTTGSGSLATTVELTPASTSIAVGGTAQLTAVPKDATGSTISNAQMAFRSTNTKVATVAANGVVTGVAVGVAYVIATSGGASDTTTVTVTPSLVRSVSVTPATGSIAKGQAVQFTAVARDAMGNTLTVPITWSSSDPSVATVSPTGAATGVDVGAATIRAQAGDVVGTATVMVTPRTGWFASPSGSSSGDGSYQKPWSLATALAGGGGRVQPGDTIWLRGGTYRGAFRSTVSGRAGAPVVVRGYPGERAIIDGASGSGSTLQVRGSYSVFWGFELTNSDPNRDFSQYSSHARPNTVVNYASHTRYVNLVVHDGGVGFYTDPQYVDVEIAGCIFYNNGWQGPTRGHGHAIYLKSYTGPVVARDNVMFNQFGYGIHVFTNGGSGKLNNIRLEGNVSFNSGVVSKTGTSNNILLGGDDTADDDVLRGNFTFFSPGLSGTNVKIGYGSVKNGDVRVEGNYFVGGSQVVDVGYWSTAIVRSNTIVGTASMVRLNDGSTSGKSWSSNAHYRDPSSKAWRFSSSTYTFSDWQKRTGFASLDQAVSGKPLATRVFVRENPYEQGRAMVVVYNWSRLGAVSADLSGILRAGDPYVVRSVQDLYGTPLVAGTYNGGLITIPMVPIRPPSPVGWSASHVPTTAPDFDVYIVSKY